MKLPIYLDYSSTTPIDPNVAKMMADCLVGEDNFGNPSSRSHAFGWKAEAAVEEAPAEEAPAEEVVEEESEQKDSSNDESK